MAEFPWGFTAAPPAPGVVSERLADEAGLVDWANAEHQVLFQATAQAAAAGLISQAWQILACQAWLLGGQGYWADWQAASQAVLAAAEAVGDPAAAGWTHAAIGFYCTFTGAYDEGRAHHQQALEHFRRAGDRTGQAWAHGHAALACIWMGDLAEAVTHCGQALELFRQVGDRTGQGWALIGLGSSHAFLGNNELARDSARQALELIPETGEPIILAFAWSELGLVHSQGGEHRQAISCYRQALSFARERKTTIARRWLAEMLVGYGDALQSAGDLSAALGAWQEALHTFDALGLADPLGVRARLERARAASAPA